MGFWRGLGNVATFGAIDSKEADEKKKRAERRLRNAQRQLEEARASTQKALAAYGEVKIRTATGVLAEFISLYKRAGDIVHTGLREHNQQLSEMPKLSVNIQEMGRVVVSTEEIAGTAGAAAVGGAAAVAGAWGLAGLIGTASTGTAIGTLSGAAATNATLAWLGGGALSAGGAGMAGGMMVLGGIALAPIALIAGGLFAAKAKEKLMEAEIIWDMAKVQAEKIKTLASELSQIQSGAKLLQKMVTDLGKLLNGLNTGMEEIIFRHEKGQVGQYSHEELAHIMNTCNTADLLFKVLDTPLMGEEGAFLSEPVSRIQKIKARMGKVETEAATLQVIGEAREALPS